MEENIIMDENIVMKKKKMIVIRDPKTFKFWLAKRCLLEFEASNWIYHIESN